MGILSNNFAQIVPGALISASYVSDIYDVLMGAEREDVKISGSLNVTGSIYGAVIGTASFASTASFITTAQTASYVLRSISSSFSSTSSFVSGSNVTATSGSIRYLNVTTSLITQGTVLLYTASLPTSDPVINGQLWRSGSYLMISTGSGS